MSADARTALGPFAVLATPAEVAAFRTATRLTQDGAALPLTFPMRWLASGAVRDALLALLPGPDTVPVHESQTFDYVSPLYVDTSYRLMLTARYETAPDRLVAEGTIQAADGTVHATLEMVLRLFSTAAEAA